MIGAQSDGWKWAQASGFSLALHIAAAGYVLFQPSLHFLLPDPAEAPPAIEVTTLTTPDLPDLPQVPTETLTNAADAASLVTDPPDPDVSPETSVTTPASDVIASTPDELLSGSQPPSETISDPQADGAVAAPDDPETLPIQSPDTEAPAPDPRLLQLVERIRQQLSDPCLLALPVMQGDGQLSLNLLSDDDRNISALMQRLTSGIEGEIAQQTLLLDSRQCPAVAFVRRDQRYPVFALGLQVDAESVVTGGSVRGRITNGMGYVHTLLLVDENGVVQDLRRFLLSSSRITRFDVPVARINAPRDTRQLLIAIATPGRVRTVAERAGDAAGPFFDALYTEIGQSALIGITSIDVR
ncbi:hypothetical protein FQV27_04950 [Paracoccus aurantiacus]|uniref:Uncharacterized protein n=1 Tax=Paracoccus aurantiacus TaxID=2599412 RepID=A0A5C6SC68_9RHOB|nr:hypothetical protein [Paracoccus aurantiacus]TXB71195.1 hypothetical protein FQV27_04950 [Paracoccus aurantiacus]